MKIAIFYPDNFKLTALRVELSKSKLDFVFIKHSEKIPDDICEVIFLTSFQTILPSYELELFLKHDSKKLILFGPDFDEYEDTLNILSKQYRDVDYFIYDEKAYSENASSMLCYEQIDFIKKEVNRLELSISVPIANKKNKELILKYNEELGRVQLKANEEIKNNTEYYTKQLEKKNETTNFLSQKIKENLKEAEVHIQEDITNLEQAIKGFYKKTVAFTLMKEIRDFWQKIDLEKRKNHYLINFLYATIALVAFFIQFNNVKIPNIHKEHLIATSIIFGVLAIIQFLSWYLLSSARDEDFTKEMTRLNDLILRDDDLSKKLKNEIELQLKVISHSCKVYNKNKSELNELSTKEIEKSDFRDSKKAS